MVDDGTLRSLIVAVPHRAQHPRADGYLAPRGDAPRLPALTRRIPWTPRSTYAKACASRCHPYMPKDLTVFGLIYDNNTGRAKPAEWERLFPLPFAPCCVPQPRCFVIMPFRRELQEVYDHGIKPAVESSGYSCLRVDDALHNGNIHRAIIAGLFEADVVIADLSGQNPNVFYELGIAHSIGNKTIMIAQRMEDVPFDIKNYKIILYQQTIAGAEALKLQIAKELRNFVIWSATPTNPVQEFRVSSPVSAESAMEARVAALERQLGQRGASIAEKSRDDVLRAVLSQLAPLGREIDEAPRRPGGLPPALVAAVRDRRAVFVVGSGLSMAAGAPSNESILEQIRKAAELPESISLEELLTVAEQKLGRQRLTAYLASALASGKPSEAHRQFAELPLDVVLTTNMDTLIERALQDRGRSCNVIVEPREVAYVGNAEVSVFKLVGSVERPDSLILTTFDLREFEERQGLLVETLTHYLATRTMIILGSAMTNRILTSIVERAGRQLGEAARPAYFVNPRVPIDTRERLKRLWPMHFVEMRAEEFLSQLTNGIGRGSLGGG